MWWCFAACWTPAWLAVPLTLLLCTAAAGLIMWKKRRRNRTSGIKSNWALHTVYRHAEAWDVTTSWTQTCLLFLQGMKSQTPEWWVQRKTLYYIIYNILVLLYLNSNLSLSQIPIYHEILDATEEEQQQLRESKVETITTTDSFYDLLQAVH